MSGLLWLLSLPFRVLGYVSVIAAFAAGFWDLWQSVRTDSLVLTPLGELWYRLSADSLNLTQAVTQRYIHPAVWDPVLIYFLKLPSFMALLIFAALVLLIAQLIYRPR
ncbi:hypothetical protein RDV64_06670 [Acuticoccus sp. MNP-M23]|uniref:hypothetical protein n=1 Tax=Acuticoccus sp. MNP-M23 TaxID=3072793 RepID=UPI00281609BB|nr:hypothetical protein [Acuticoccus sp. MNP-M23]WMS44069.1 hypothetical protein RDV64_06670 [Acuticoccus sp. MNP-M23]